MAFGILEVELISAKGLKGTDFIGKIDPYVIVKYRSQERESTVANGAGAGGSPVWNQRLRFRVDYPVAGSDYKLILKIMDRDTFSRDDYLGQATIYVKDVLELGVEKGSVEFQPHKYNVVKADQSYAGEIKVGLSFTLKVQEEDNGVEEYGGWKQSIF